MLEDKDQQILEQIFLGSVFAKPNSIMDINLEYEDFMFGEYANLFDRMRQMFMDKKRLIPQDFLKDPLGFDEILSIVNAGMGDPSDYAEELRDQRKKRDFKVFCDALLDRMKTQTAASVLSDIAVFIKDNSTNSAAMTVAKVREQTAKDLTMPVRCYPTGLFTLDTECMSGGLYEGYTYGLCGAEKMGKTTLAHTISYNLNQRGVKHMYVAMEMGSKQIEQRNIARELGFNSARFLDSRDLVKKKMESMDLQANNNTIYLDAPGMNLEEILFNVSMAQIKYGIKGFFIDYWQLVGGKQKQDSEEKHLRDVAQGLANYARKQGLWCVLLAQMNKDGGLFGGNGLRKACDQLYMIEEVKDWPKERWLRMDASRYTERNDIGSASKGGLRMNTDVGPYFEEM